MSTHFKSFFNTNEYEKRHSKFRFLPERFKDTYKAHQDFQQNMYLTILGLVEMIGVKM